MSAVDEIRQRLERATDGPWERMTENDDGDLVIRGLAGSVPWFVAKTNDPDDAEFIAHAPEDIRSVLEENEKLVAEIERLLEENAKLREQLAQTIQRVQRMRK